MDNLNVMGMEALQGELASRPDGASARVHQALCRISQIDGEHRAWVHVADPARLAALAAARDRRRASGTALSALDGMVFSVKDSQHVAGLPTAFGSVAAEPVLAVQSSPIVERLEAAGAIALGKTALPEFSWKATTESPRTGVTRNPRFPQYSPGGSSGGAAVSVAQGVCWLATGTDAAGSVRIPAAFTSTVGFKPSDSVALATTAVEGFKRIGHWGLHTSSAADMRQVWGTLYPGADAAAQTLRWARIDDSTRLGARARRFYQARIDRLAEQFGPASAVFRPDWALAAAAMQALYFRGCFETVERIDPVRRHWVDPGLAALARRGACVGGEDLRRALGQQQQIGAALDRVFASVDVVMLPTVAFDPPLAGEESPEEAGADLWLDWAYCTYLTNLTGHPSLSLAGELEGVPFGLQIIGRKGGDAELLAVGEQIEAGAHP